MALNPNFPIVSGHYRLTETWSLDLPGEFNRRIEGASMVLWRPGFTMWVSAFGNDHNESVRVRLHRANEEERSPAAYDIQVTETETLGRLTYRLDEARGTDKVNAIYVLAFAPAGQAMLAIYFDSTDDLPIARQIAASLAPEGRA